MRCNFPRATGRPPDRSAGERWGRRGANRPNPWERGTRDEGRVGPSDRPFDCRHSRAPPSRSGVYAPAFSLAVAGAGVRGTPGVRLLVILSPEHGLRGTEDRPGLPDAVDSASGLPIYSLYGGTPLSAIAGLDSVDVVLVDLQDIGARYYRYPHTAVLLVQEGARR